MIGSLMVLAVVTGLVGAKAIAGAGCRGSRAVEANGSRKGLDRSVDPLIEIVGRLGRLGMAGR